MNLIYSLWDRFLSFVKREKWAYVKIFVINDVKYKLHSGKVYIHLYESNKGNRKIKSTVTIPEVDTEIIDNFVQRQDLYQTKLVRWLEGRADPDIPCFSQIGEEDTVNALKGSV